MRRRRNHVLWLSGFVLTACAVAPDMPDPSARHPASPAAEASAVTPPSTTLALPRNKEER